MLCYLVVIIISRIFADIFLYVKSTQVSKKRTKKINAYG